MCVAHQSVTVLTLSLTLFFGALSVNLAVSGCLTDDLDHSVFLPLMLRDAFNSFSLAMNLFLLWQLNMYPSHLKPLQFNNKKII